MHLMNTRPLLCGRSRAWHGTARFCMAWPAPASSVHVLRGRQVLLLSLVTLNASNPSLLANGSAPLPFSTTNYVLQQALAIPLGLEPSEVGV